VGIIERGQLLFNGGVDEILRRAKLGHVLHVGVADRIDEAGKLLATLPGVKKVALANDDAVNARPGAKLLHVTYEEGPGGLSVYDVPSTLINRGFRVTKIAEEPVNLETAFMRLTKGLVQ
jgi:ABC-2 type transport system ATP-binding protein